VAIDPTIPGSHGVEQAFDLNIEEVLEHWTIPSAICELIANALNEQALTGTADPEIFKDGDGYWHVADLTTGCRPKEDFPDVVILHALVATLES
jgi:hypothetical protein